MFRCKPFVNDFLSSECIIITGKQLASNIEGEDDDDGAIRIKIQTKESHSKQEYKICTVGKIH